MPKRNCAQGGIRSLLPRRQRACPPEGGNVRRGWWLAAGFAVVPLSLLCSLFAVRAASPAPAWTGETPLAAALIELGEKPSAHALPAAPSAEAVARGRALIERGEATGPGGETPGRISQFFACTDCHNTVREDPRPAISDPEARLTWALEKRIPLLQGTTLHGVVNRESWYNDDYLKKYGAGLLANAQRDLREATQICAEHCSQGRRLEGWELEAVLAFYWSIELRLRDLDLTPAELARLNGDKSESARHAAARDLLHSRYLRRSPATFGQLPPDVGKGYPIRREADPVRGGGVFTASCLACHAEDGPAKPAMKDDRATLQKLSKRLVDTLPEESLYHTLREGTHPAGDRRSPYMPHYPQERLSDAMIEDLRAFLLGGRPLEDIPLGIELTADKTAYRRGEPIRLTVGTREDAWLRLLHEDAAGEVRVLLPNRNRDGRIRAGERVTLDASRNGGGGSGEETIAAVVSTEPFQDDEIIRETARTSARGFAPAPGQARARAKGIEVEIVATIRARAAEGRFGVARARLTTLE